MKPVERLATAITLCAVAGGAAYYGLQMGASTAPPEERTPIPAARNDSEPKPKYPVPSNEKSNASNSASADFIGETLESSLGNIVGRDLLESIFNLEDFVRRVVVAIESATSPVQLTEERSPLKSPSSTFVATGNGSEAVISEQNYARYKPYVEFASSIDPHKLVKVYVRFYPLFQAAYRELGTNAYFNDRVVEVIDHILKTPEVAGDARLYRPSPKYRYKFANLELENLSSSQKVLIRMGYENARVVRVKLRAIRRLLVRLGKENGNLTLGAVDK